MKVHAIIVIPFLCWFTLHLRYRRKFVFQHHLIDGRSNVEVKKPSSSPVEVCLVRFFLSRSRRCLPRETQCDVPKSFWCEVLCLFIASDYKAECRELAWAVRYDTSFLDLFKTRLESECLHTRECCTKAKIEDSSGFDSICLSLVQLNRILSCAMYLSGSIR